MNERNDVSEKTGLQGVLGTSRKYKPKIRKKTGPIFVIFRYATSV